MANMKTAEQLTAEIERMNALIAEEEAGIEALYPQIGRVYCNAYADAPADAVKELVGAVNQARANIDSYLNYIKNCNRELGLLRGFVSCEKCGNEVSVHSSFCGACGASMSSVLAALAAADDIICPSCGFATPHGSVYCEKCGTKIVGRQSAEPVAMPVEAPVAMPVTEPVAEPVAVEAKQEAPRCPSCGTVVEAGDIFCLACGFRMA